jgi:hypothetical protein
VSQNPQASFEVTLEQWKNYTRQWAKSTARHPAGDPQPVILFATPTDRVATLVDPILLSGHGPKDVLFYEILPKLAVEQGAHLLGWFSACWYTELPAHIEPETPEYHAFRRDVEAWRARHGTLEGHRATREGVVLIATDGYTFVHYRAEMRRHRHKLPTFGPWRADRIPFVKQLAGEYHGGRIAQGMAIALAAQASHDDDARA